MFFRTSIAIAAILAATTAAQAQDSAIVLGQSTYNARCALCHGETGKGDGEIAALFQVPPSDLTTLSERNNKAFPFSKVYQSIASGVGEIAHGNAEMPVWGDYFLADAMQDRGMSASELEQIVQGRILSVTYYLQSIQQ